MSSNIRWIELPDRSLLNFSKVVQIYHLRKSVENKGTNYTVRSFIVDASRRQHEFLSKIWEYAKIHNDKDIFSNKNIVWCHREALRRISYTTQFIVKIDELTRTIWETWIDKHKKKHKRSHSTEKPKGAVTGYYGEKSTKSE